MANSLKGEVELKAGAATLTLVFSINAIIELETLIDMGVNEIAELLGNPETIRLGTWRAILWAGLRENHPGYTLADAGRILGEATLAITAEAIGEALTLAFPNEDVAGGEGKNPQAAGPDGTGQTSTKNSLHSLSTPNASGD